MTPRRYLALWFPLLPTERLGWARRKLGDVPDEAPLVLVQRQHGVRRLFAVNRLAATLGLAPGLTLAEAQSQVASLVVAAADPLADADFLAWLATLCERFSPLVALSPPDGLVLDITGCAHLFGGEAELFAAVLGRLQQLGLSVRARIAGTPDAARALTRFGEGGNVETLPVAALEVDAATTQALLRAGLKTIGDLAERPAGMLTARFGAGPALRLARILGQEDARIVPLRPAPDCLVERQFLEPLVQAQALGAVLDELVAELAEMLTRRGAGGRCFEASLFRSDGQVRRILVETGRPSRGVAALRRLFALRIAALSEPVDAGFGLDAVRLAVAKAEPLAPVQPGLDGRDSEAAEVAELIDRLVARFGRERVLRFAAHDSHIPERAASTVAATLPVPASRRWAAPPGPPRRPLRLFDPPEPIETLAEVPDGTPLRFRWRRALHEVALAEGPERIAPEWWRAAPDARTRDYYRLEDRQGQRFWVYREGLHGEDEAPRWFLHGLFA